MLLRELAKTPMEFEFSLSYELVQCLLIDESLEIPEAMWVCALNCGLLCLGNHCSLLLVCLAYEFYCLQSVWWNAPMTFLFSNYYAIFMFELLLLPGWDGRLYCLLVHYPSMNSSYWVSYECWSARGLSDWLEALCICFPSLCFFSGWYWYKFLLSTGVCLVGIFIIAQEGSKKRPAADTHHKASRGRVDKSASTYTSRARATPTTPAPAPPAIQNGEYDRRHLVSLEVAQVYIACSDKGC